MLVGRQAELHAIEAALAAARLGRSARLLIRGEPGIGKTALLEHAVAGAREMQVLSARAVEFEADLPFAALHELLRPVLGTIDQLPPAHASALRSSLGLGERIRADRLIVGAALLGVISAAAERSPLLIVIDDAHWMDRESAEAIAFAARRLSDDPVAVIVAVREAEDSPFVAAGLPTLVLEGLDRESAAQLLGAPSASSDFVARMLGATGGNPLALIELGHAGTPPPASPLGDLPLETSVERAYLRRAAGLGEGAQTVLLLAAAAGETDSAILRRAGTELGLGPGDFEAAETTRGVVAVRGRHLEFVHPLARAAMYHAASPGRRRAAHRALAAALVGERASDRRAWHLAAGAEGWDAAAADGLEEVAANARASTGYDAASQALAEAARLTESPELRAQRLYLAADNAWQAGRGERAVKLIESAEELAGGRELRLAIALLKGHIAMRRGAVMEGFAGLLGVAGEIETTDRLAAIRTLADASLSTFGAGRPAETLGAAERALELITAGDPPDAQVFARVSYGVLAVMAGHGDDGPRRLRESIEWFAAVPASTGDALLLMCEGMAGLFLRDPGIGRELLEHALNEARQRAPAAALPQVLFMLGRDAAATDRWEIARADYEEAARLARETTQFTWLAGATAGLAWLDALEGRIEECGAHAAEARTLSEQYGMGLFKAWSMIALGQLQLGLGVPLSALDHFEECLAFLDEISIDDPDLSPAPDMVDALVRLGRVDEARRTAEQYSVSAAAKGLPFAAARAARARGLVAPDASAVAEFEFALRHHAATGDTFERARTQLYLGERLRRLRRRLEARSVLHDALRVFDALRATPWAERAVWELRATGETARVRDDGHRNQLTPQELQVALTLAEGATTREAAARLYLSPKTVEYHLRHVYDKLEIRSREELRAALGRQAGVVERRPVNP